VHIQLSLLIIVTAVSVCLPSMFRRPEISFSARPYSKVYKWCKWCGRAFSEDDVHRFHVKVCGRGTEGEVTGAGKAVSRANPALTNESYGVARSLSSGVSPRPSSALLFNGQAPSAAPHRPRSAGQASPKVLRGSLNNSRSSHGSTSNAGSGGRGSFKGSKESYYRPPYS